MFNQNGHKAFDGAQDGSVNDNWAFEPRLQRLLPPDELIVIHIVSLKNLFVQFFFRLLFFKLGSVSLLISSTFSLVLQVETNRELEVTLYGTTLVGTLNSIVNFDVDLWTVESAISSVDLPWSSEFVKSVFESFLSIVPLAIRAKTNFGSGRQLKIESETKNTVHML